MTKFPACHQASRPQGDHEADAAAGRAKSPGAAKISNLNDRIHKINLFGVKQAGCWTCPETLVLSRQLCSSNSFSRPDHSMADEVWLQMSSCGAPGLSIVWVAEGERSLGCGGRLQKLKTRPQGV